MELLESPQLSTNGAIIGISDHGGWAILVTVSGEGTLLERRRVELVDDTLPALPHHHEGQLLPIDEAVALVERVRVSAQRHAVLALRAVASAVPNIAGIALRTDPPLPATVAERITNYRARNVADWVMYRKAFATAAEACAWHVHWCDAKAAIAAASDRLELRSTLGPPWTKDHKLALALAIAAQKRESLLHGAVG